MTESISMLLKLKLNKELLHCTQKILILWISFISILKNKFNLEILSTQNRENKMKNYLKFLKILTNLNKEDIKIAYQILLDSINLANKNVRFLFIQFNIILIYFKKIKFIFIIYL